jgi:cytochrome c oxidase subunit 2
MFSSTAYAASATLPIQASDIAASWDTLYLFLFWLSVLFFIGIVGAMVWFCIKYRSGKGLKTKYMTGNHLLEAVWIVLPTVLLMVIFGWGYSVYHSMTQAPTDAMEIRVIAKQWLWQFQYDDGRVTAGEVYVPLGKPVKFLMTSEDVIHSFFLPTFRVKQDVVPGMYTSVWIEAKVPGKHQIYCAEYCGTSHSGMLGKLIVLDEQQWKDWSAGKKLGEIPDARDYVEGASAQKISVSQAAPEAAPQIETVSLSEQGRRTFELKGCVACHSVDGSPKTGPTLKNVFGHQVELNDGKSVLADENYLRESIEKPQAKIVKGYGSVMPTFQGLVSETEMTGLIAYIKSASKPVANAANPGGLK